MTQETTTKKEKKSRLKGFAFAVYWLGWFMVVADVVLGMTEYARVSYTTIPLVVVLITIAVIYRHVTKPSASEQTPE